jgi:hypothetical protein
VSWLVPLDLRTLSQATYIYGGHVKDQLYQLAVSQSLGEFWKRISQATAIVGRGENSNINIDFAE